MFCWLQPTENDLKFLELYLYSLPLMQPGHVGLSLGSAIRSKVGCNPYFRSIKTKLITQVILKRTSGKDVESELKWTSFLVIEY